MQNEGGAHAARRRPGTADEHHEGRVPARGRAFLRYIEIPGEDPPLLWGRTAGSAPSTGRADAGRRPGAAAGTPLAPDRHLLGHGYSDRPPDFADRLEDHARTIVALIRRRSAYATAAWSATAWAARSRSSSRPRDPPVVSLLVMAEVERGTRGPRSALDGQAEDQYVGARLSRSSSHARPRRRRRTPASLRAAHLGITRLVEPRAIHREALSLERRDGRRPCVRSSAGLGDPAVVPQRC